MNRLMQFSVVGVFCALVLIKIAETWMTGDSEAGEQAPWFLNCRR